MSSARAGFEGGELPVHDWMPAMRPPASKRSLSTGARLVDGLRPASLAPVDL
jgi:hypothetical protein